MSPDRGDDELVSLRELARRTGVSEGTLRNWEKQHEPRLRINRRAPRSATSTIADLRAFCAAHPDLPGARKALVRLDSPAALMDVETLRWTLEAVIVAVRATMAAHIELADNTTTAHRAHATALTGALRGLDDALARIAPADGRTEA
ncbi:transposase [Pseudonocardia sp. CA-107938]|uniref:transposase n=1 Tax=Pseudonocardia sp. CA-107938 TaxID=3240021 RepID=UPI003D947F5A